MQTELSALLLSCVDKYYNSNLTLHLHNNVDKSVSYYLTHKGNAYYQKTISALFCRIEDRDMFFRPSLSTIINKHGIGYFFQKDGQMVVGLDGFFKAKNIDALCKKIIDKMFSFDAFGCCGKYLQCSDAKKCVHDDLVYAMACAYRKNLEAGNIFYGKNKNIDIANIDVEKNGG